MRVLVLVFMAFVMPVAALASDSARLTVTGLGQVDAPPDMATLQFGVVHDNARAEVAMARVSADMAAILDRLAATGLEPRDMQTSGLDLSPVWSAYNSGQQREITGFRAANMLMVRIRALDGLGPLLDQVIATGANSFQGIGFGLQTPGPVQDEARRLAVADAMRKAQIYARAAGLGLGDVISISETGSAEPRPMMMAAARSAEASVPVAPGEVSLSARVTMVFDLTD